MSGVKGRSGRRVWSIEEKRHHIIDKAWELTAQKLESEDKDRFDTAKDLVLKDMINKEQVDLSALITNEEQGILSKYISGNRIRDISTS